MNSLIKLIQVRKLMALSITVLFLTMSLMGQLETNFVQTVIIAVVSFYFGKSTALDRPNEKE